MDTDTATKPLPNRPDAKLPPLSKGSRVQKRPLARRTPLSLSRVDVDGYISPSFRKPGGNVRTPTCVYVGSKTPFMAVVKRVRKALESSGGGPLPRSTRGLPLTARVAALSTSGRGATGRNKNNTDGGQDGSDENTEGEVIVLGTGKAIEKTLNVAAWFQRQNDCRVSLRTRSVAAVDDVVLGHAKNVNGDWDADADPDDADAEQEGDDEAEEHSRVRMVSCLEVAVRLL
ncbi:hypothetical protein BR93DRAFT_967980 [Coniochaeta sp. PMI_546]|nr:hypothetical protein BR93DRAFT_967980 [Coniochaeta sp. PMI_546]